MSPRQPTSGVTRARSRSPTARSFNLGGVFTTDALHGLGAYFAAEGQSLASFTINLTGTLDNSVADNAQSAGVLGLGASTGPLNLAGGRIYQGMITTSGSDHLVASEYLLSDNLNSFMDYEITGGTLDGVTLDGTLDIPLGCGTEILGSLTLNGTIDMGAGQAWPLGRPRTMWHRQSAARARSGAFRAAACSTIATRC